MTGRRISRESNKKRSNHRALLKKGVLSCVQYLQRHVPEIWNKVPTKVVLRRPRRWFRFESFTRTKVVQIREPKTRESIVEKNDCDRIRVRTAVHGLAVGRDGAIYRIIEEAVYRIPRSDGRNTTFWVRRRYLRALRPSTKDLREVRDYFRRCRTAHRTGAVGEMETNANVFISAIRSPKATDEFLERVSYASPLSVVGGAARDELGKRGKPVMLVNRE